MSADEHAPPVLPYGGDIQEAMRHEDRDAIRLIMSAAGAQPHGPTRALASKLTLDDFTCSICTELLYKPCVSACGHAFCFWCLHKAMDPLQASQCPLCRQGFKHFAAPVAAFHRLLSARFPDQMASRAEQVRDAEENEFHAKSMIASVSSSSAEESGVAADDARAALTCVACGQLASPPLVLNCGHLTCGACLDGASRGGRVRRCPAEGCGARVICEPKPCQLALALMHAELPAAAVALAEAAADAYKAATAESAAAAVAAAAVSNAASASSAPDAAAGDVTMEDEDGEEPTSPLPPPPLGMPTVATADSGDGSGGASAGPAANVAEAASTPLPRGGGPSAAVDAVLETYTHFGVGCDGCGVYPIRGARWKCLDCPEEIGFDLCGFCQEAAVEDGGGDGTGSGGDSGGGGCGGGCGGCGGGGSPSTTVAGRFGQVHTSAHRMVEQPRPMTWIHTLQAAHPELGVHEVIDLVRRAVGSGVLGDAFLGGAGGDAEAAFHSMLGPPGDFDEEGEDVD